MKNFLYTLLLLLLSVHLLEAQQLKVASYNVRYDNQGDADNGNGWQQRLPVLTQLILFHDFDIFGSQEVLHHQLTDMLGALSPYAYIGVGRDDGKTKGEYAPIFYKKDKFKVLQSGHFWLSTETDHPNKGWDAVLPRICTWGEFQEKDSKLKFYFFNLHMDHVGVKARQESAKLVLAKIKEMCGGEPVILTGDFNVDQSHKSYALLANSGILEDSYETTQFRYAPNGTFNNFNTNLKTDSRIDHVFVSPLFRVVKYGVLTDTYRSAKANSQTVQSENFPKEVSLQEYTARTPSDHFPVVVELEYAE